MKKLVLVLGMLIALSGVISAGIYTTDRTYYYWNGSHYLTDGVEEEDIALDGTLAVNGDLICSHGWENPEPCEEEHYTNAYASLGTLSIQTYGGNSAVAWLHNASFTGTVSVKVYDTGVSNPYYIPRMWDTNDVEYRLGTHYWDSTSNYVYYENGYNLCDINTIPRVTNEWVEIIYAFNGTSDTINGYIDGKLCHTWTGAAGIERISPLSIGSNENIFWDEFWVSNGNRPMGDSDGDGILDSEDNCRYIPNLDQNDIDGDCSYFTQPYLSDIHCGDACDNCLDDYNPLQEDNDNDDTGNVCDSCADDPDNDVDDDFICVGDDFKPPKIGGNDNCPNDSNTDQSDMDVPSDGIGDVCDNCWFDYNPVQGDLDGDCPSLPYTSDPKCGNVCDIPSTIEGRLAALESRTSTLEELVNLIRGWLFFANWQPEETVCITIGRECGLEAKCLTDSDCKKGTCEGGVCVK